MTGLRVAAAAVCAAAVGAWVGAGPMVSVRAQQAPVFTASTQWVEVDVRPFDRNGRFIDDLVIEDFEVLEAGTPQRLRALYFVGPAAAQSPGAPPLVTARGPEVGAIAPTAPAGQTWIFVFDINHLTPGGGFERARQAVTTFLTERFRDGDVGGVMAGGRMVNNRLTSVRAELASAVASVRATNDQRSRLFELTREWPRIRDESEALAIAAEHRDAVQRAVTRACSDDQTACQSAEGLVREKAQRFRTDAQRSTREILNAMQALASGLSRIPGPKTVVFLSEGFVTQDMESSLQAVAAHTARAGARIYAIDVRGLNRGSNADLGDRMLADSPTGGPARLDITDDAPNSLSVDTGGFFIRNQNNIGQALAAVADDANRYYVIGYQPDHVTLDGSFRPIEVRVKRPGVTIRARRGYLAIPSAQLLIPRPIR